MQQIGNGQFHVGDCFDVMKTLPDASVDMVLCDLPYGTTACKWDAVLPWEHLWAEYRRVSRSGAAIVLTAAQPFTTAMIASNMDGFCYQWIWNKRFAANFVQAKRMPMRIHEDVIVFSGNGKMPTYFPQKTMRDKPIKKGGNKQSEAIPIRQTEAAREFGQAAKSYDDKHPETIIEFSSRDGARGLHPTQKPVALFEYLIRTYTNEGDVVLDNTAGSGTTAIAAEQSNRRWICIERDEAYAAAAQQRIRDHTGDWGDFSELLAA